MSDFPVQVPAIERPFFEGCQAGVLRLQYCSRCQQHQFYPRIMCQQCWGRELDWVTASGAGIIRSYTVARVPVSSAYQAPYVVALVQLAEGPTMMSQLTDCVAEDVKIGAEVKVAFTQLADWQSLPVFKLVEVIGK
jgi:uncharacterized OB-fold protein